MFGYNFLSLVIILFLYFIIIEVLFVDILFNLFKFNFIFLSIFNNFEVIVFVFVIDNCLMFKNFIYGIFLLFICFKNLI